MVLVIKYIHYNMEPKFEPKQYTPEDKKEPVRGVNREYFYRTFPNGDHFNKDAFNRAVRVNTYFDDLEEKDVRILEDWSNSRHNAIGHEESFSTMAKLASLIRKPLVEVVAACNEISENDAKFLLSRFLVSKGVHSGSADPVHYGLGNCPDDQYIRECLEYGIKNKEKLQTPGGYEKELIGKSPFPHIEKGIGDFPVIVG